MMPSAGETRFGGPRCADGVRCQAAYVSSACHHQTMGEIAMVAVLAAFGGFVVYRLVMETRQTSAKRNENVVAAVLFAGGTIILLVTLIRLIR